MRMTALLGGIALAAAIAGPAPADQPIKLGFITKFPVPFFATMENAAKAYAAAHPGVEIIYGQGASATDIEGQIALIESMVTKGVQGIAITPVDPTVATTLDKAVAKGVKVVLMDNKIPNWKGQTALATTNNLEAGKIAGAYLKSVLKDGDTLGVLEGVPGVPALDDRVNGMLEGLKGVERQDRRQGRNRLHRRERDQRRSGYPDREPASRVDLFRVRSARRGRRPGDQERQARSPRHSGRFRLLLRRGGSHGRRHRGRLRGAVPGEDGGTRRGRARKGASREKKWSR